MVTDRSIPFRNILMRRDRAEAVPCETPRGFRLRGYQSGDDERWAELEHRIGDFDSFEEALVYFREKYLPRENELADRMFVAESDRGEAVGAVIAWTDENRGQTVASVHWLAVRPDAQNRGLGRALVCRLLRCFAEKGESPVYLHTQPWSYVAVGLYSSLGFRLLRTESALGYENQTSEAVPLLPKYMAPEKFRKLMDESV